MLTSQRDHRNGPPTRPPRPSLTVDTQAPRNKPVEGQPLRSAPVGTRQEKGIPPMYQVVDRHCEKLAEMMNSPTWRSQNSGPHIVKSSTSLTARVASRDRQSPSPPSSDEAICEDEQSDIDLHTSNFSVRPAPSPSSGRTLVNEIQLGRNSDALRVIGLHEFMKTPEGTYILSAAPSCGSDSPQEAIYGEMRRVKAFQQFIDDRIEAEGPAGFHTEPEAECSVSNTRETSLPVQFSTSVHTDSEVKSEELDDVRELMKQDEAIQSIHKSLCPAHLQGRPTSPDEKQRFGGILHRLRQQGQTQPSSDRVPFGDPAIVAFAPKAEDSRKTKRRSENLRSDSGYSSPSGSSRASTAAFRKLGRGSSADTLPETFKIQHSQGESKESVYDSPSKNSTLNPAAKEFSGVGSKGCSPVKPSGFIRSPIHDKLWLPPQKPSELVGSTPPFSFDPVSNTIQPPWCHSQTNTGTPLMTFGSMQPMLSPPFPGLLPRIGELVGGAMPSPPGLGITSNVPPIGPFTGFPPGSCQPCVHGSMPGFITPSYSCPFHQQLPSLVTCNNPAHQKPSSSSQSELAPPISAAMMSQGPMANLPLHMAVQPSPSTAHVPKHVPKPKVPNTTGQQNWELMHELRRMHEPGYAMKCKEKQKKRYLKQLEKTGGSRA